MNKFMKIFVIAHIVPIVIGVIAHFVWQSSGSGEWEYVGEQNGVKVYSLKEPGEILTRFKGVTTVNTHMDALVKLVRDPSSCDVVGCYDSQDLEVVDDSLLYTTFKYPLPEPMTHREYIIKSTFAQDPKTKAVEIHIIGEPDRLPPNDCCVRVTDLHNVWKFTPKGNSKYEIEFLTDFDIGGSLPYFMQNMGGADMLYEQLGYFQGYLDLEQYKNAEIGYVDDV